jgi:Tol biopolymer transport system component
MKLFLIFIMIFCSCNKIKLPGEIILEDINHDSNFMIYRDGRNYNYSVRNDDGVLYRNFKWLNKEDFIVARKEKKNSNKKTLVRIDIQSNEIKHLFDIVTDEILFSYFPSPKGNMILTLSTNNEGCYIRIIDVDSGKIFRELSFYRYIPVYMFSIKESPWSPDENYFVFSINWQDDVRWTCNERNEIIEMGIYLYDIRNNELIQVNDVGNSPVWSPDGKNIAYIAGDVNNIRIFNIEDISSELLYIARNNEVISQIHWTPDSNHLFVICPKVYLNTKLLQFYNEKLIKFPEGNSVPFKKLNKGFGPYSWR